MLHFFNFYTWESPSTEFMKVSQTLQDSRSGGLEKSAWPTTISPDRHHKGENDKRKIINLKVQYFKINMM